MGRKKPQRQKPGPQPKEERAQPHARTWPKHLIACLSLCALTLAAYSNSFIAGFTFDNVYIILKNPFIREATWSNVSQLLHHTFRWPTGEIGLYRPFTSLTLLFNYAVLGNAESPPGYHWVNFLLHAANVLLVYVIALKLARKFWLAVSVAALWAVHPVLTESVTNIIGRSDLLAGLSILGGFWVYLKSTEANGPSRMAWLAGLTGVTAVGVFSKENGVAILGVMVLYEFTWWKERREFRGLLYGCLAVLAPILAMLYVRSGVMAASPAARIAFVDNPLVGASIVTSRLTAVAVMARYLWLLVWPAKLSCDYSYAQILFATGSFRDWIAWLVVVAVVAGVVFQFRRNPLLFFFAAFAFLLFLPTANLVFLTGTIMAERFLYLPAVGFAACVVLLLDRAAERVNFRRASPVAVCLIVAALGVRTWYRNADWKDDLSLNEASLRTSPNSFKTHSGMAMWLSKSGTTMANIDAAIAEAEKSLAILQPLPDKLSSSTEYLNAGLFYQARGDLALPTGTSASGNLSPESLRAYQRARELLLHGIAIELAGDARGDQGPGAGGKPGSEPARPNEAQLYEQLGRVHMKLREPQQAYEAAVHARQLAPRAAGTSLLTAEALIALGRKEESGIALMTGLLATGNKDFLAPLNYLYQSGLDPQGCAFQQTPSGPFLNNGCQPVHDQICKAYAELIQIDQSNAQRELVEEDRSRAVGQYGCSSSVLEPKSPRSN